MSRTLLSGGLRSGDRAHRHCSSHVTDTPSYRRLPSVSPSAQHLRKLEQPQVVWALLDALQRGESLADSLRIAGVGQSTFYRERRKSPFLRGLVEAAEAAGRAQAALHAPAPIGGSAPPDATPVRDEAVERPPDAATDATHSTDAGPVPTPGAAPAGPQPVERPNVAGVLDRLAPGPPSRTLVVPISVAAPEPPPPLADRATQRVRNTLSELSLRVTRASREAAEDRRAAVRENADDRAPGPHWLPPMLLLVVQLIVVVLLVGNIGLPLGIAAMTAIYVLAVRPRVAAHRQPEAVPAPAPTVDLPAEAPVEATRDLRWIDATLSRRPPVTRGK